MPENISSEKTLSDLRGQVLLAMTNVEMCYPNVKSAAEKQVKIPLHLVRQIGRNAECLLRLAAQYEGILLLLNSQTGGGT